MSRWFSLALLAVVLFACKPRTDAGGGSTDAALPVASATTPKPALPPEPSPPVADKASEAPGLEAALAKDAAYQAVWTGPRADLNAFLSYVSELLATGAAPAPFASAVKAKKLQDAGIKLYMVLARVGRFPEDFGKKLAAHLDATKGDPHAGTWSTFVKGGATHDYAGLATWSRPDDATLLREHIASKRSGAGPFGWEGWQGKGDAPRPWLVDEGAALDRLALLAKLTDDEQARRESLRAVAKKEAAAQADMASAVQVSAGTLFSDYQGNEVSADEKYKGKRLVVAGTVGDVRKGPLGGVTIGLSTSNPFMPVDASLEDSETSKAGKLAKGDNVKLLCKGQGMVLGRPQIDDCIIR